MGCQLGVGYGLGTSAFVAQFLLQTKVLEASSHSIPLQDLRSTKVIGDVAGLASLHALSYLSLQSTMVSGELSGLSALSGLKHLDLQLTQVSGSIAALTSLR